MNKAVTSFLLDGGADLVRYVDISRLPAKSTRGFSRAAVFSMALSPGFVRDMYRGSPTPRDEFLEKEAAVESLADRVAGFLTARGFGAHSQSAANNLAHGYGERGYIDPGLEIGVSPLPQKTLSRLAGIGFVGRNNLLVSRDFGCAIAICSVLTDAPLLPDNVPPVSPHCGGCTACIRACPTGALLGGQWTGKREDLLDISRCACPLRCMMHCPWTKKYANLPTGGL